MSELSTDALHMTAPLRTGRRVGRTIYAQLGPEPSDIDPLVATADSPVLAERIVRAVNAAAPIAREDAVSPDEDERVLHVGDKVHLRWLDESGYHHGHGRVAPADGEAFKVRVELVKPDRSGAMPSQAFDAPPAVASEEPTKTAAEVLHDLGSGSGPGWRRTSHCCADMTRRLAETCPDHPSPWDCPDVLVTGPPRSSDYGLWVHDGGSSYIVISYCPWCGAKLNEGPAVAPDGQSDAPTRDALVGCGRNDEDTCSESHEHIDHRAGHPASAERARDPELHERVVQAFQWAYAVTVRSVGGAYRTDIEWRQSSRTEAERMADVALGVLSGGGADGGGEDEARCPSKRSESRCVMWRGHEGWHQNYGGWQWTDSMVRPMDVVGLDDEDAPTQTEVDDLRWESVIDGKIGELAEAAGIDRDGLDWEDILGCVRVILDALSDKAGAKANDLVAPAVTLRVGAAGAPHSDVARLARAAGVSPDSEDVVGEIEAAIRAGRSEGPQAPTAEEAAIADLRCYLGLPKWMAPSVVAAEAEARDMIRDTATRKAMRPLQPDVLGNDAKWHERTDHSGTAIAIWLSEDDGSVWVTEDGEIAALSRYSGHYVSEWHGEAITAAHRWREDEMPVSRGEVVSGKRAENAPHGTTLVRVDKTGRALAGSSVIETDGGFNGSPTGRYRVLDLPTPADDDDERLAPKPPDDFAALIVDRVLGGES